MTKRLHPLLFASRRLAPSAFVPGCPLARGLAPAGPLTHVGVADVEVGDHRVALFQAEELAHAVVVDDGARTPHRSEAEGMGRELHVLHGGGARGVVLSVSTSSRPAFEITAMTTGARKAFLRSRLILPAAISSLSPSASAWRRAISARTRASSPRPFPVKTWKRHGSVSLWLGAWTALSRMRSTSSPGQGLLHVPYSGVSLWPGSHPSRALFYRASRRHNGENSHIMAWHTAVRTGGSSRGKSKVTVVGAGNVGGTTAQRLAERNYADVVLVDIVEGLPQGKALDILESGPVIGFDSNVIGTNGYEESAGSDVVVITSGSPRKPGMSRDDLLKTNQNIVRSVTEEVVKYSPETILVMVANPLDAMCHVAMEVSGFPRERVVGMAGILDTARYRTFIAQELRSRCGRLRARPRRTRDTMVPLPSMATVGGVPITKLLPGSA